jgi:protein gp37
MKNSHIEWTNHTWNVAVGCRKVDEDCKYCYMYRDSLNETRYDPKVVRRTKTVFDLPLRIKEPGRVFTSSLTDFFLPEIDEYRDELWDIIRKCPHLEFQILTKRPERVNECLPYDFQHGIFDHVLIGTSVGSMNSWHRIEALRHVRHTRNFVSFEPLHGPIDRNEVALLPPDWWIIVGGESGNDTGKYRYRPCELKWIEDIVAGAQGPVFVKQLGTHLAKQMGLNDRHGRDITEFPAHLRIREFPRVLTNKPTEI